MRTDLSLCNSSTGLLLSHDCVLCGWVCGSLLPTMSTGAAEGSDNEMNGQLRELLHTLLEAPPSSLDLLCVQLSSESTESPSALAEKAVGLIHTWQTAHKAAFIHGHPRIGEQSNLSALSAAEQAKQATPPEVLERLQVLNQEYERRFPGLR